MNDDLDDLERKVACFKPATPSTALRGRIVLQAKASPGSIGWQGIAAALLAVLALVQIIASTRQLTPPRMPRPDREAVARSLQRLDLSLRDDEASMVAGELIAGAQLKPLPEIHGRPSMHIQLEGMP